MSIDNTLGGDTASANAAGGMEQTVAVQPNDDLWTGSYRVYEGKTSAWVIDAGEGTKSFPVDEIYIYTNAFTKIDRSKDWPIAWLEGFGTAIVANGVAVVEDRKTPVVRTA